jgi:hypothetical protein
MSVALYFSYLRNVEVFFASVVIPMQLAVMFSFGTAVLSVSRLDAPSNEIAKAIMPRDASRLFVKALSFVVQLFVFWSLLVPMLPFLPLLEPIAMGEAGPEAFYASWLMFSSMASVYFIVILPAFWKVHGRNAT